jgi:thymidine kinase
MSLRTPAPAPAPSAAGRLTFEYGPMEAGKTHALHARHMEAERGGETATVLVCDPGLSVGREARVPLYKTMRLLSDVHHMAHLVGPHTDLLKFISARTHERTETLLVDNAHFLTERQVRHLLFLAAEGAYTVYCYGLRADFRGSPFAASALLMARADTLVGHTGRCHCGARSTATIRIDVGGRVVLGGDAVHTCRDAYRSLCTTHWNQATRHRDREPTHALPHSSASLVGLNRH